MVQHSLDVISLRAIHPEFWPEHIIWAKDLLEYSTYCVSNLDLIANRIAVQAHSSLESKLWSRIVLGRISKTELLENIDSFPRNCRLAVLGNPKMRQLLGNRVESLLIDVFKETIFPPALRELSALARKYGRSVETLCILTWTFFRCTPFAAFDYLLWTMSEVLRRLSAREVNEYLDWFESHCQFFVEISDEDLQFYAFTPFVDSLLNRVDELELDSCKTILGMLTHVKPTQNYRGVWRLYTRLGCEFEHKVTPYLMRCRPSLILYRDAEFAEILWQCESTELKILAIYTLEVCDDPGDRLIKWYKRELNCLVASRLLQAIGCTSHGLGSAAKALLQFPTPVGFARKSYLDALRASLSGKGFPIGEDITEASKRKLLETIDS